MRERQRRTRSWSPGQLVLLVVMITATACGHLTGTAASSTPPNAQAAPTPPTATTTPVSRTPGPAAATPTEATATNVTPTMDAATPVRLQIPAIGVDSDLMNLGLQTDGTLEVPPAGFPAGWYTGAPTPGQLGPAIIAGHVDWGGQPGVFFDLRDLTAGDEIHVIREDGSTARFRIDRIERFAKDQFPTQLVYADLDHAGLRLITCGGDFDRQTRSYKDNLIVFARLLDKNPSR